MYTVYNTHVPVGPPLPLLPPPFLPFPDLISIAWLQVGYTQALAQAVGYMVHCRGGVRIPAFPAMHDDICPRHAQAEFTLIILVL